jgi:N utilization substance protein B
MSQPFLTPRQRARELAFQFLYRFYQDKKTESTPAQIAEDYKTHVSHFESNAESEEFALRLIQTTLAHLDTIDPIILQHLENWRLERVGAIEKSFLRMGTAELLYFKDVPASVTLDEVVELSKRFGENDTPLFLNGILDPISKLPEAQSNKVASLLTSPIPSQS